MDPIYEIDLDVCPHCGGVGAIQDEPPEERLAAARQVAHLWNIGKVIHAGVGD